jgi:hypothetical protein
MSAKRELYHLVDSLPLKEIRVAKRFLEFILSHRDENDPTLRALLDAPEDEEPPDALEIAGIEEGRRDIARGDTQSWDEVKKEFGLL